MPQQLLNPEYITQLLDLCESHIKILGDLKEPTQDEAHTLKNWEVRRDECRTFLLNHRDRNKDEQS